MYESVRECARACERMCVRESERVCVRENERVCARERAYGAAPPRLPGLTPPLPTTSCVAWWERADLSELGLRGMFL